ncbi:MAG TPA: hypothetical protein VMV44_09315 [Rectinemataceae bacterium]|nr:hypothetical protein [Rectinemataceae bacterium]
MKNITVSLPEELARWARLWAAEQDSSVSALLARLLQEKRESESRYQAAMTQFLSQKATRISDGSAYPSRESIHER